MKKLKKMNSVLKIVLAVVLLLFTVAFFPESLFILLLVGVGLYIGANSDGGEPGEPS